MNNITFANKPVSSKILAFVIGIVIAAAVFGYYLFEWSKIKALRGYLSKYVNQEFALDEEFEKKNDKLMTEFVDFYYYSPANSNDYYQKAQAISQRFDQSRKLLKKYFTLGDEERAQLKKLRSYEGLLIGGKGKFFKKTTAALVAIDQKSEKYTQYVDAEFSFLSDLASVLKDMRTLSNYNQQVVQMGRRPSPAEFGSISYLEKYLDEDHSFKDEEKIKQFFPYSGEVLDKYRNYFAAYYSYEKSIYSRDNDSFSYKSAKLSSAAAELNIDSERLFSDKADEMDKIYEDYQKNQVEVIKLIKEFKKNGQGRFLIFEAQEKFPEDLMLCGVYANKTFGDMLQKDKKNPSAKNAKEIQKELSDYDPDTAVADKDLADGSVEIINSDDKIGFKCTDKNVDKTYTLSRDKVKQKIIEK